MKLYFNLIPIVAPEQEIVLKFFTENVNNACIPLSINELPKEYRKLHNKDFKYLDYLYCDIDNLLSLEGNQTIYDININLNKTPNFALHYFRHLIYNYFRNIKDIVISTNMINDIEIYLPAKEQTSEIFTLYPEFSRRRYRPCLKIVAKEDRLVPVAASPVVRFAASAWTRSSTSIIRT